MKNHRCMIKKWPDIFLPLLNMLKNYHTKIVAYLKMEIILCLLTFYTYKVKWTNRKHLTF
jgi:hypothetical protein